MKPTAAFLALAFFPLPIQAATMWWATDAIVSANSFSEGAPATHRLGDSNYNGVVDLNDAILFANAYNESLQSLPEPATLVLLAAGGAALLGRHGRSRSHMSLQETP